MASRVGQQRGSLVRDPVDTGRVPARSGLLAHATGAGPGIGSSPEGKLSRQLGRGHRAGEQVTLCVVATKVS